MDATSHPPADQLRAFAVGALNAGETLEVSRHLELCTGCCERLETAGDDHDSFVNKVRNAILRMTASAD